MESTKKQKEIKSYNLNRFDIFDKYFFDIEHGLERYDHPRPQSQQNVNERCKRGCACEKCEPPIEDMTNYGGFLTY